MSNKTDFLAWIRTIWPALRPKRAKSQDIYDSFAGISESVVFNDVFFAALKSIGDDITRLRADIVNKADATAVSTSMTAIQQNFSTLAGSVSHKQNEIIPSPFITPAAENASSNAPTTLSGLIVTTLTLEVNNANTRYNDLAVKYNDLAKKFNVLVSQLIAQGLKLPN